MTTTHCSSCGSTDSQDLAGGDGYTSCCNKRTCDGGHLDTFGTRTVNVRACCWGTAEAEFDRRGIEIPDGASNLTIGR